MRSLSDWSGGKGPQLSTQSWNLLAIPAAVLVVMATLQIISFGKFKDWLDQIRVGWPAVVAVVVIIAELWGALSLLRISMHGMLRILGVSLAVIVSGFWFLENLYVVTGSYTHQVQSSGLFGKYLSQTPGWWTVIEVTILLFWIVYAAELLKPATRR